MNEHVQNPQPSEVRHGLATTQGAEGLPRLKWSRAQIEAMTAAGIFMEDDRFELIDGEIVPMSPKGLKHEMLKRALGDVWHTQLPEPTSLMVETTLWFDEHTFLEPDFLFFPREACLNELRPNRCLLAVEIGVSSLAYDLGTKATLYARGGLPELWVINGETRETTIHTKPDDGGYQTVTTLTADTVLALPFASDIAITLAALDLR